jgi:hypothetical protein
MTALQQIIKEAKILRKKNPKMEWKKAVAQASAIYASKHKGKSPVGKKHKKVARKKAAKKKIGKIDPNKAFKKQMQVNKIINTKFKNYEYPVPPVYTGNWTVQTWSDWIKKNGRKIGSIKKVVRKKPAKKRKPTENAVLKSIKHAVKVQKSHMGGIGSAAIDRIKSSMSHLSHYDHAHKRYMSMSLKERKLHSAAIKKLKHLISETKTHINQLKKSI